MKNEEDIIPDNLIRYTNNTITDRQKLIENLKDIQEKGYAFDNEEVVEGLTCVAAPIFNHAGKAIYSISISGPTIRMTEEKINKSIELIKEAAEMISSKIGYFGH